MTSIPISHIQDSHELVADAMIDLYELTPANSTGVIRFKSEADITWLGNLYAGIPVALTGEKKTSDTGLTMPTMTIGQENIDLTQFKGVIFDGGLDNAIILKYRVKLSNLLRNLDIKESQVYRVKRVESYSSTSIQLQLATLSDSLGFSLPYRTYESPDFPSVQM